MEAREAPAESSGFEQRPRQEPSAGNYWDSKPTIDAAVERFRTMFHDTKVGTGSTEDLAHGQVVIIAARWILVASGLILALWNPASLGELQVSVMLILGLAMGNFFLHARLLMGRPISSTVAYAASAADIAVISLVLIVGGGFDTIPYVFYFPAVLALSVAFPTRVTAYYVGATALIYGLVYLLTAGPSEAPTAINQMLMLAAVAVCGNVYWRIEKDRRLATAQTRHGSDSKVKDEVPTL